MRAIEITRRLILVVGVLTAGALAIWPVQTAWRVGTVDFAAMQKEKVGRLTAAIESVALEEDPQAAGESSDFVALPLDQFIAQETKGRLIEAPGADWQAFCSDVQVALAGGSDKLSRNLERGSDPKRLYFPEDTAPLAEIAGRPRPNDVFTYVHTHVNGRSAYLEVLRQRSGDLIRQAPTWIVYPWRQQAAWIFALTLAAYALLPWHRRRAGEVRPMTVRAIILPDFLGLVLTAMFFLAPIFIIPRAGSSMEPWEILGMGDGWGILTLVMWFMSLFGLGAMVASLGSAVTSLEVLPDRIRKSGLRGVAEYPYAEIASVEPARWEIPAGLRLLMILVGLFNWRLLGMVLITTSRSMTGITLCLKDGKKAKVWIDAMPDAWRAVEAMRAEGIPLSAEVAALIPANPEPQAPAGGGFAGRVVALAAVAVFGGGAIALAYLPEPVRTVQPARAAAPMVSMETFLQRQAISKKMQAIQPQLKAAIEEAKKGGTASREALDLSTALLKQFQDLQRQLEEVGKPDAKADGTSGR